MRRRTARSSACISRSLLSGSRGLIISLTALRANKLNSEERNNQTSGTRVCCVLIINEELVSVNVAKEEPLGYAEIKRTSKKIKRDLVTIV